MKSLYLVLLTLLSSSVFAQVPHVFKAGDTISAEKFNQNFSAIDSRLNSVGSLELQVSKCGGELTFYHVYVLGTSVSGITDRDGKIKLLGLPVGSYDIYLDKIWGKPISAKEKQYDGWAHRSDEHSRNRTATVLDVEVMGNSHNDIGKVTSICQALVPQGGDILDLDADNFPAGVDCNDLDFSINPFAVDVVDGIDNDCDGEIDNAVDKDGDGSNAADDCNDQDASIFPGADEIQDGLDNDCDGYSDEPANEIGVMCTDNMDNDYDGDTDAADSDCAI